MPHVSVQHVKKLYWCFLEHIDHRIVQLLENISGFVSLLMSTELLFFGKSEQRKGRLELPVFKLDRR